jgi:hypothetical protein
MADEDAAGRLVEAVHHPSQRQQLELVVELHRVDDVAEHDRDDAELLRTRGGAQLRAAAGT